MVALQMLGYCGAIEISNNFVSILSIIKILWAKNVKFKENIGMSKYPDIRRIRQQNSGRPINS